MISDHEALTILLNQWVAGDEKAGEQVLQFIYAELKKQARAHLRHESQRSYDTTDLLHEAIIVLQKAGRTWDNRKHFYYSVGQTFRRLLVDEARKRKTNKRGSGKGTINFEDEYPAFIADPDKILQINRALETLETMDEEVAQIVVLRFFVGLTIKETADAMAIPRIRVERGWAFAKVWLMKQLNE